jgi:hypothetical protein
MQNSPFALDTFIGRASAAAQIGRVQRAGAKSARNDLDWLKRKTTKKHTFLKLS